ncbi:hypothetical protein GCM10023192_48590 [Amycolatopsis samaneae]
MDESVVKAMRDRLSATRTGLRIFIDSPRFRRQLRHMHAIRPFCTGRSGERVDKNAVTIRRFPWPGWSVKDSLPALSVGKESFKERPS